jgi:hypothetical protein
MRESSPGGSYGTASHGRAVRPEAFPYEGRLAGLGLGAVRAALYVDPAGVVLGRIAGYVRRDDADGLGEPTPPGAPARG